MKRAGHRGLAAVILGAAATTGACAAPEPVTEFEGIACTDEQREAVLVTVLDTRGVRASADSVTVSASNGRSDECFEDRRLGEFHCGELGDATYEVTVTLEGRTLTQQVTVPTDECHVIQRATLEFDFSGGASPDECIAVRVLDSCCLTTRAVPRSEALLDPCLAPLAATDTHDRMGADCTPADDCALVDCDPDRTFTRVAEQADDGTCQFVDECQSDDDCVAVEAGDECNCCESVAVASLASSDWPELSCSEPPGCQAVDCADPFPNAAPTCALGTDGFRHCVPGPSTCEERVQDADTWLRRHQDCNRDEQCVITSNVGSCLSPICFASVREDQRETFELGILERDAVFRDECNSCPPVDCADPNEFEAVCEDFRCTTRPTSGN